MTLYMSDKKDNNDLQIDFLGTQRMVKLLVVKTEYQEMQCTILVL